MRISLRLPTPADAAAVAPWLPEAAAAVHGRGTAPVNGLALGELLGQWDDRYPPGQTLIAIMGGGEPVGLARVRDTGPARLVIDALTVRADARNLGYGQEVVYALEAAWPAAEVAAAGVPRANGLAVYFWLRTGYHPLYPRDGNQPADLDPALLWMVRRRQAGA